MSSNAQALLDPESPMRRPVDVQLRDLLFDQQLSRGAEGRAAWQRADWPGDERTGEGASRTGHVCHALACSGLSFLAGKPCAVPLGDAAHATAAATLAASNGQTGTQTRDTSAELERQLVPLCAYYLLRVKRGDDPADPVARFHLRNGARLERINWLSDTSTAGLKRFGRPDGQLRLSLQQSATRV